MRFRTISRVSVKCETKNIANAAAISRDLHVAFAAITSGTKVRSDSRIEYAMFA
jgi:hypothetical protein